MPVSKTHIRRRLLRRKRLTRLERLLGHKRVFLWSVNYEGTAERKARRKP